KSPPRTWRRRSCTRRSSSKPPATSPPSTAATSPPRCDRAITSVVGLQLCTFAGSCVQQHTEETYACHNNVDRSHFVQDQGSARPAGATDKSHEIVSRWTRDRRLRGA